MGAKKNYRSQRLEPGEYRGEPGEQEGVPTPGGGGRGLQTSGSDQGQGVGKKRELR